MMMTASKRAASGRWDWIRSIACLSDRWIRVGERQPFLAPGLAGPDGRHGQPVFCDGLFQLIQVDQLRVADGQLDAVVTQRGDLRQVRFQVAFEGGSLELRGLEREDDR